MLGRVQSVSELTPEQLSLLDEIESDEPSEAAIVALAKAIEKFDFSASLLAAFASWLRDEGDPDGADIVLRSADEMAIHEASS